MQNVNYRIRQSPLLKPKLFFAFSKRADAEVVGTAKDVLGEFQKIFRLYSGMNYKIQEM